MPRPRSIVVVPCHDEEQRLDCEAFVAFVDANPGFDLLFVDDGSRDGTGAIIEDLGTRRPGRLRATHLKPNRGKAEAVRRGVLAALADHPDTVGFWDADLATPLADIPVFQAALDEDPATEMVLGSRVLLLGRRVQRDPRRHYFGRVAATAVSQLLGLPVYDTQCGAKLFRVTPHLPGLFAEPFVSKWAFDVEILARWLIATGRRTDATRAIVELPLRQWTDVAGSKLGPKDFLNAPIELWRIWRRYGAEL